jgi:hypothetical protein
MKRYQKPSFLLDGKEVAIIAKLSARQIKELTAWNAGPAGIPPPPYLLGVLATGLWADGWRCRRPDGSQCRNPIELIEAIEATRKRW